MKQRKRQFASIYHDNVTGEIQRLRPCIPGVGDEHHRLPELMAPIPGMLWCGRCLRDRPDCLYSVTRKLTDS